MDNLKFMARAAKQRLKTNFWDERKRDVNETAMRARECGINENAVKNSMYGKIKEELKGVREDEFYLKVKELLDNEGEVSDAIGRLTDREYYETLTYEEKQRYNLQMSAKYLAALERYRKEKAIFN